MESKHIAPFLLILVGFAMISATAQENITLRFYPQTGTAYTIGSKKSMLTKVEIKGRSIDMSVSTEIKQSFVSKSSTETQMEIETQVESVKVVNSSVMMGIGAAGYDSEHPKHNSPEYSKQYDPIIKTPFTATYDEQGKVIKDIPELTENLLDEVVVQLPKEEINVGSQWSYETSEGDGETQFNIEWTYTVTAISKKKVEVNVIGNIKGNSKISGMIEGSASIHPQLGMIIKSNRQMTYSMIVTQEGGDSIPTNIVITSTIEVKEK